MNGLIPIVEAFTLLLRVYLHNMKNSKIKLVSDLQLKHPTRYTCIQNKPQKRNPSKKSLTLQEIYHTSNMKECNYLNCCEKQNK